MTIIRANRRKGGRPHKGGRGYKRAKYMEAAYAGQDVLHGSTELLREWSTELSSQGLVKMLAMHGWSSREFAEKINIIYEATENMALKTRCAALVVKLIEMAEGHKLTVTHQFETVEQIKEAEAHILNITGLTVDEILDASEQRQLEPGDTGASPGIGGSGEED